LRLPALSFLFLCIASLLLHFGTSQAPEEKKIHSHFVDITDAAGVTFRHISAAEKKYIVESIGGGVALGY